MVVGMIGRTGGSSGYTAKDFEAVFPELLADGIPAALDMYIELAHACISKNLYKEAWKLCMSLFIAHNLVRANQLAAKAEGSPVDNGRITSSASVDGVSVSYDTAAERATAEDFGELATTVYGRQLIYWIRMMSIGGLYV